MSRTVFGTPKSNTFDKQYLFSYELPPEIRDKYRKDNSTGTFIPNGGGVGENIFIYPFTKELSDYYEYNEDHASFFKNSDGTFTKHIPLTLTAEQTADMVGVHIIAFKHNIYRVGVDSKSPKEKSITINNLEFQGVQEGEPIYLLEPIRKGLGFLTETSGGGKIKRKWSKRRRLRLLKKRVSRKRIRRRSKGPKA
jgi:hypothetical protein